MNFNELHQKHTRQLLQRTLASFGPFLVFVVTSVKMALDGLLLRDPVSILSIVAFLATLMVLPRNFRPAWLNKAPSDEAEFFHNELRPYERAGLGLRVFYSVSALFLIGLLPRLVG